MRARSFVHLAANGTTAVFTGNLDLGIVVINTKGVGNTLTLTDGAGNVIAIIDTTVAIGGIDYGQLALNGLVAILAGGTSADVTISWN
jgi:hypothetical protein